MTATNSSEAKDGAKGDPGDRQQRIENGKMRGSGGASPDVGPGGGGDHARGAASPGASSGPTRCPRPANSMDQDSFDSYDEMEDMLVAQTSGLRLASNNGGNGANAASGEDELPKSVIVTNVDLSVFDNEGFKANFETMFREFDSGAQFHYLRSFRRIRVDLDSHVAASKAKANLDGAPVGEGVIHCYLVQVLSPCTDEDAFLHVPPLQKQFLISPPCSPPVGWEQPAEAMPVVDYDLIAAVAQLAPGEKHELHPTKQIINVLGKSVSTPSIVVHVADDGGLIIGEDGLGGHGGSLGDGLGGAGAGGGVADDDPTSDGVVHKKIRPTRCPERQSSLD